MNGIYKIADCCIEIRSLYSHVHELCRDYRCESIPDFAVEPEQKDIDFERERSAAEDRAAGLPV